MGESSEFFRAQHGDEEVAKQRERDETDDDVFHRVFSELLAETDVEAAGEEEARHHG